MRRWSGRLGQARTADNSAQAGAVGKDEVTGNGARFTMYGKMMRHKVARQQGGDVGQSSIRWRGAAVERLTESRGRECELAHLSLLYGILVQSCTPNLT